MRFGKFAAVAAFVGAFAVGAAAAQEKTFKVSHVFSADHPVHLGLSKADELLKQKSGGRFALQIFPSGTFASYRDAVTAVQMGTLDMAPLDTAIDCMPASGVMLSPYTFRDYDHWRAFKGSEVYGKLLADISEACGVQQLSLYTFGFRHATTGKVKATTPDEFKDLKLRVANFAPYPEAATVLGATGTPLPVGDVYLALSNGVADGQENPFTQIVTMKLFEVQKHLILTGHMLASSGLTISQRAWDELSTEDQALLREVFTEAAAHVDSLVIDGEAKLLDELTSTHGMEKVEVDKQPFMDRVPLVLAKYPEFKELYDQIQAIE
ncbi:tripartite ATP-independent transporter DctP family solute receptor [Mycoplana sp. BE70]|uniref:TRAP transporter substrate-binding protein n=1 Tax=Mycoplana sp. BE70 TaxID=2817775 RepID=UPI0028583607|nr:TRAP transporter substrate-binding protein [Mycoplana sp. BE70]MDR6756369.1 tripartite ATP-independent transporter DctP family solute receptor [Mycoplana sp. BE70]